GRGAGAAVDLAAGGTDASQGEIVGREVLDAQLAAVVRRLHLAGERGVAVDRGDELVDRERRGRSGRHTVGRRRVVGNTDGGRRGRVAGGHGEVGAVGAADVDAVGGAGRRIDAAATGRLDASLQRRGLTGRGVGERI